ncbi:MAG: hypothetical protein ACREHD_09780, partial [Pirellulales bacterium]
MLLIVDETQLVSPLSVTNVRWPARRGSDFRRLAFRHCAARLLSRRQEAGRTVARWLADEWRLRGRTRIRRADVV